MQAVKQLRAINFSIVEQRQQALEVFNNLPVIERPFARNRRFPDEEFLLCTLHADWPRKIQQLCSALSFKNRQEEVRELPVRKEGNPNHASQDDAQQAFWNATTSMHDELVRGIGIFSRHEFESTFGLRWTEPEPPLRRRAPGQVLLDLQDGQEAQAEHQEGEAENA